MEKPIWQREMESAYLRAHHAKSHDISGLYIKLEKISKKYMDSGIMKDGDSFRVPISDGVEFHFTFYKNSTAVDMCNPSRGKDSRHLLTREDGRSKEIEVLDYMSMYLDTADACIGEKYPDTFKELLKGLKPGEVISFTDGNSYACLSNAGNVLDLSEVITYPLKNIDITNTPQLLSVMLGSDNDLQMFYDKNCKYLTERVEFNITLLSEAKEAITKAEQDVLKQSVKKYAIGNNLITAKRAKLGNTIRWYDESGRQIDKDNLEIYISLFRGGLRERVYSRETVQPVDLSDDRDFEKQMELLSIKQNFTKMHEAITEYVNKNNGALTLNFNYFKSKGDGIEYIPQTISFVKDRDEVHCYKILYENNDLNKDKSAQIPISDKEFNLICKEIYSNNHEILRTREEDRIVEQFKRHNKVMDPRTKEVLNERIEECLNEKNIVFFGFSATDKELTDMLNKYNPDNVPINKTVNELKTKARAGTRSTEHER